jgi:hypothetical protein
VQVSQEDPFAGHADPQLVAKQTPIRDDLCDPSVGAITAAEALDWAKRGEKAALDADPRIQNRFRTATELTTPGESAFRLFGDDAVVSQARAEMARAPRPDGRGDSPANKPTTGLASAGAPPGTGMGSQPRPQGIDPLPDAILALLASDALRCSCGRSRKLWITERAPLLKCIADTCGKSDVPDMTVLGAALRRVGALCQCGAPVHVARAGSAMPFVGCSAYPECRRTQPWRELRDQLRRGER